MAVSIRRHYFLYMLCFSLLFISGSSFCQQITKVKQHQRIYLSPPSQKIVADVLHKKTKKKLGIKRTYFWYDNSNIHQSVGGASGYLLDGSFSSYYFPSGNLNEQGTFRYGLKKGKWIKWHENGKIQEVSYFKRGFVHNKKYEYNIGGHLLSVKRYKNSILSGKSTTYDTIGNPTTFYYRHGRQVSSRFSLHKKTKDTACMSKKQITPQKHAPNIVETNKNSKDSTNHKTNTLWQKIRAAF